MEAKIQDESEKIPLAPRNIYTNNIGNDNLAFSPFIEIASTMPKRRGPKFPDQPKLVVEFKDLLRKIDFGRIEEADFYRNFPVVNEGSAFTSSLRLRYELSEKLRMHISTQRLQLF